MDNRIITTDVMEEDFFFLWKGIFAHRPWTSILARKKTKNTLKVYIEAAKQRHDSLTMSFSMVLRDLEDYSCRHYCQ